MELFELVVCEWKRWRRYNINPGYQCCSRQISESDCNIHIKL